MAGLKTEKVKCWTVSIKTVGAGMMISQVAESTLPMREHRDRAIVVLLARVMVNHFVQRGARRHRVQQQDDAHQQGGQGRFANLEKWRFMYCKSFAI